MWEYKVCYLYDDDDDDHLERTLNNYGSDGWELVTTTGKKMVFKRPIIE